MATAQKSLVVGASATWQPTSLFFVLGSPQRVPTNEPHFTLFFTYGLLQMLGLQDKEGKQSGPREETPSLGFFHVSWDQEQVPYLA